MCTENRVIPYLFVWVSVFHTTIKSNTVGAINIFIKYVRLIFISSLLSFQTGPLSAEEYHYSEDWVGLWIEENSPFPEFSNFYQNDSYILITDTHYVIGRTNWAGRRWGGFDGSLQISTGTTAFVTDVSCEVILHLKSHEIGSPPTIIVAFDNNGCGGVNVRFNARFIKFFPE